MPLKIYRRPGSNIYHYRGTLAGHRCRGTTGSADKEDAQRIAAGVEDAFWKRRADNPPEILTFPKAVALYLAAGKSDRFLAPLLKHFGNTWVADLNAGAIRQAAMYIYPYAAAATRNRQVIVPMQAIINHAAEMQLCQPLRMKRFKTETRIKQPIMLEWLDQFRAHAEPEIGALALFLYATGARISEALSVRWSDVDIKARKVLIRQSKLGNEREAHLPINVVLAIANLPRGEMVFDIPYTTARDAWDRTAKAAGLDVLTFHSCRHGFATALLQRGVDVVTVAKLGGWKSPAHVFQTYGHAQEDSTLTEKLFDNELTQPEINKK